MGKYYNSNNQSSRVGHRFLAIFGILLFLIGLASLVFSVIELFHGRPKVVHYDETQGGLKIENPLWPSSGKGFWVGLVLMATGLLGVLASREGTRSSIIGFTALATLSTILSFYMMITSIIPVRNDVDYPDNPRPQWQTTELVLNSLLIAAGALGTIVGTIASIVGCVYTGCCVDQRDSYFPDADANPALPGTPSSMRYPQANVSRVGYPYQQPTFRMPM